MEILIFTDNLGNSGIQRVLSELTGAWIDKGHKVSIVHLSGKEEQNMDYAWRPEIERIGITVKKGGFVAMYADMFRSFLRILKNRPDAVAVSLSVMTNFVIGACALFVKNKIVISDRNDPTQRPKGKLKQIIRDYCFKQADTLILQTEDVHKYYEERIHRSGIVIPNPINDEISQVSVAQTRRKVVVTASRLNKQKNLGMLITAFSLFVRDHDDYTLEIFGRGEEEENLRKAADELGVSGKVVFKGFSSDIYHDIVDCGIYVCSSDYEGISNSLIEALGLGIPTISTDCPVGGSRMLIENGVNGILIPVGDTQELAIQMARIADSDELAARLSENAVKVRERFRVDKIAQRWVDAMQA